MNYGRKTVLRAVVYSPLSECADCCHQRAVKLCLTGYQISQVDLCNGDKAVVTALMQR